MAKQGRKRGVVIEKELLQGGKKPECERKRSSEQLLVERTAMIAAAWRVVKVRLPGTRSWRRSYSGPMGQEAENMGGRAQSPMVDL
jgi:hypothetical protein